ncbi:glycosyltransferase family 4 protein [Parvibaculum sp.]|uniref:glycosyltransferase family 4 protein n=1 Tax=Parvibaculum sp. TaxID=2024848 RepID=UPI00391AA28E
MNDVRSSLSGNTPGVDFLFIAANSRSLAVNRKPVIQALQKRGLTVGALVPDEEFREDLQSLNVTVWPYALDRHGMGIVAEIRRFMEILSLIRRIRPKAVLGYAIKPVVLGIPAARLAGVRETYCLTTGMGYLFGSATTRVRVIRWGVTQLFAIAGALSRAFFFQNPDDCAELRRNFFFRRFVKSVVVNGSGVDIVEYPFSSAPADPPTFLFMGRFLREKGIYDLVEAAKIVRAKDPSARIIALGSGDATLVNSISDAELEAWRAEGVVEFPGRVRDVRSYLTAASVVVLPSYYREGIPRTLLEALSTGRAIVTCDSVGCRETVEQGCNGWLVPPQSPEALADRMLYFIENPEAILDMGRRSREIAEARFTVGHVAGQMLAEMEIAQLAEIARQ